MKITINRDGKSFGPYTLEQVNALLVSGQVQARIHRFYVGRTGSAVVMLLLTLSVVGVVVSAIWSIVDWILIVCGSFADGEGRLLERWT